MTLGLVKNMNALVCFFKEAINITERITTAIVDTAAKEIGKYITPTIKVMTKSGDSFPKCRSIASLLLDPINKRQPADISHSLEGIKKYAAG